MRSRTRRSPPPIKNYRRPLLGAVLFAFIALPATASGEMVVSHLSGIYAEQDNNVFEETDAPRTAFPLRLVHNSTVRKTYPHGYLNFRLRTGYRHYPDYQSENTLISYLAGSWRRSLPAGAAFRFAAQGRIRGLIDNPRNYKGFNLDSAVLQELPHGFGLMVLFGFSELHYQTYPAFNYRAPSVGIELRKGFVSSIQTRVHYQFWYRDFIHPTPYQSVESNRQDMIHQIMLDLELYHLGNLVRPSYILTVNRSGIGVFSYNSHRLRIQFGTALTASTYLGLYITLFQKYYLGGGEEFAQVKVDPEVEEETKLAVQLSQSLPWHSSIGLRYVRCHNETIFRDRYYSKDLLSVSFSRTF